MTEKDLELFKMDQGKKRRRTHRFGEAFLRRNMKNKINNYRHSKLELVLLYLLIPKLIKGFH